MTQQHRKKSEKAYNDGGLYDSWFIKLTKTRGTKEWACKNVNFTFGCSNNCQYCYARRMAHRFKRRQWEKWGKMVNREEVGRKKFKRIPGTIMSPSSHDLTPHNLELAKKVLMNIVNPGNHLLIVSKPNPQVIGEIVHHLEAFQSQIVWRFTRGTLNDEIRNYWEPGAPPIPDRISILRKLAEQGWETSVSIEPFLDNTILELIELIDPYVTGSIWIGPMNRIHVSRKLWNEELNRLYSPENLTLLKNKIQSLHNGKIKFKDHFLNKCNNKIT